MAAATRDGRLRRLGALLWAALRLRCPRCRTGRLFRGPLTMNDPCPVCGLLFQREEGYFLGSMYVSYVLSSALLGTFFLAGTLLLPGWSSLSVALLALVPFLPLVPAVFRYSRVFWIYLERAVDPNDASAGAYEKFRRRQLAQGKGGPAEGKR
jgi:uncharacterized protein (DUF983 family)